MGKHPDDGNAAAPGRLKRANCLCGAIPPQPSEYADYDTPPFGSGGSGHATPFQTDLDATNHYFAA